MDTQLETVAEDSLLLETVGKSPLPATTDDLYTYTYMFSVCIFDDTACCDAIVYGKEGERLLAGVTAEQLYHNPALQQSCQQKLERAIAEGVTFEFEVVTYLTANQPSRSSAMSTTQAPHNVNDQNKLEEQDTDRFVDILQCYEFLTVFNYLLVFYIFFVSVNRPLIKRVRIVNSSFFQQDE
jgi:hypothetical protein